MSAPLVLTSQQLSDLSAFLHLLTKATIETGCHVTPYQPITVSVGGNHGVEIAWSGDLESGQYVIDTVVGS